MPSPASKVKGKNKGGPSRVLVGLAPPTPLSIPSEDSMSNAFPDKLDISVAWARFGTYRQLLVMHGVSTNATQWVIGVFVEEHEKGRRTLRTAMCVLGEDFASRPSSAPTQPPATLSPLSLPHPTCFCRYQRCSVSCVPGERVQMTVVIPVNPMVATDRTRFSTASMLFCGD